MLHEPITEMDPESLRELLQKRSDPSALVQAAVDEFSKACASDEPVGVLLLDHLLRGKINFSPEQLLTLFHAALALSRGHAASEPAAVARRLFNLAHVFFAGEFYLGALVVALTAVETEGGKYNQRPDCWAIAAHAAWQCAAFRLAAECYAHQLQLAPQDSLAQFNYADSIFRAGEFANAYEAINQITLPEEGSLADTMLCMRVTLGLVVESLGLSEIQGHAGNTVDDVIRALESGEQISFSSAFRFNDDLVERLGTRPGPEAASAAIARAYITDAVDDWAAAAFILLSTDVEHVAVLAVLRKGNSRGPLFRQHLEELVEESACAIQLPNGEDVPEYLDKHASYASHQRSVNLVDETNAVVAPMRHPDPPGLLTQPAAE